MLEFTSSDRGGVAVLRLVGNLDAMSATRFKRDVTALLDGGQTRFVFDLGALTLIDSSGVGALVSTLKRSRSEKGDLRIAAVRGQPAEIFKLLRLDRALDIFESVDQAVLEFGV